MILEHGASDALLIALGQFFSAALVGKSVIAGFYTFWFLY